LYPTIATPLTYTKGAFISLSSTSVLAKTHSLSTPDVRRNGPRRRCASGAYRATSTTSSTHWSRYFCDKFFRCALVLVTYPTHPSTLCEDAINDADYVHVPGAFSMTSREPREPFREIPVKVHIRRPDKDNWTYMGRAVVAYEPNGPRTSARVGMSSYRSENLPGTDYTPLQWYEQLRLRRSCVYSIMSVTVFSIHVAVLTDVLC
jgi:hypothetical protein